VGEEQAQESAPEMKLNARDRKIEDSGSIPSSFLQLCTGSSRFFCTVSSVARAMLHGA